MFSSLLIGLREGLEAALVVGILIAYLVRTERTDRLRVLWVGVAAAIVLSLAVGALLEFTAANLSDAALETFVGITSLLTVAFVTTMVFWLQRTARHLKSDLEGHLSTALAAGPVAILVTAFMAVVREGVETALFLWSNVQTNGDSVSALVGGLIGITLAVLLGWAIYRGSVNLDLAKFFTVTGVLLIVIAAGVLTYGLHELAEAGRIPETAVAFDISSWYAEGSWYGALLKGILGFRAEMLVLEVAAWFAYVVPVTWLFLRGIRKPAPVTKAPAAPAVPANA